MLIVPYLNLWSTEYVNIIEWLFYGNKFWVAFYTTIITEDQVIVVLLQPKVATTLIPVFIYSFLSSYYSLIYANVKVYF